ncbi:hypothetical protein [Natronococcus jeotgali]|uniref:Uncharacterized protein n=1 Tax=Natronococcus jeotgali DSM 18795 TaxID=1227498 RepID=L9WV37_9EURY|nr:hypothetical protein [Natronococcus jeotgali]ELY53031.1 hypothetical protein C492_18269 [Natronococcus jeotgali DSM 18795]
MELRQRLVVGTLWIGVAALIASTLFPISSISVGAAARLFVVVLALFLAGIYLFDPWGVLDRQPFH